MTRYGRPTTGDLASVSKTSPTLSPAHGRSRTATNRWTATGRRQKWDRDGRSIGPESESAAPVLPPPSRDGSPSSMPDRPQGMPKTNDQSDRSPRNALSRDRLFWVEQNYLRAQTLSLANARLVNYHMPLPLVQAWGGGELASANGLRFVTSIRTLNSGPNPKYFGTRRRGVTFYNFLSDQFSGLHGILIPGTQRDSFYILDGLLEHETPLRPVEITSDTHGSSEIVFGLFRLMGYQFSPRLADAGSAILYRADPDADYGHLNDLTRDKINLKQITTYWDDMLRLADSLHSGTITASEALRVLAPAASPPPPARPSWNSGA